MDDNGVKFQLVTKELLNIFVAKNHDYGNAYSDLLNKYGLTAAAIHLEEKLNRFCTLMDNREKPQVDESLRDTLKDLANYAILTILWLDN